MQLFSAVVGASALLIPTVMAVGTARVYNNCNMPVYFASVAQSGADNRALLPPSGYSEVYSKPDVGVSIKLSETLNGPVTQFEFTWAGGNINYDISNINGNPFWAQGMSLVPSAAGAAGYTTCQPVVCPAGQQTCTAAYNQPDDTKTMVCPDSSDLTFTLCPGASSKREAAEPHAHGHRVHARHLLKR